MTKVGLSFDRAPSWREAELEPADSTFGIQSWTYAWSPAGAPEIQKIMARATDSNDGTQPLDQRSN